MPGHEGEGRDGETSRPSFHRSEMGAAAANGLEFRISSMMGRNEGYEGGREGAKISEMIPSNA